MKAIDGRARTLTEILKGKRYAIDYYQREYRWQRKQAQELIEDLAEQFLDSYDPKHKRSDVAEYGHYFLGSIILSDRDGKHFIVDGQQRLTTLTLLLILLHRTLAGRTGSATQLQELIYSEKFGERAFNISVPERTVIMEALFRGDAPDTSDASESVQTIVQRYDDIAELLPGEIEDSALLHFSDWLIEKVYLVEITASNDEDAYTIFETMNDRGLSLSPLDMLKGYLLSNIKNPDLRNQAAKVWRERIEALRRLGKDEDADAFKAWLRSRYAQNVRERRRGSENADFESIGTEFHRWVGMNAAKIGLSSSEDFFHFVHDEMSFYTRQYERLRRASWQPESGLEPVYHVACFNFTLQYPLLLAPLLITDDPVTQHRKIRAVAIFLDILLARRASNYLRSSYGDMAYATFLMMKAIRGMSLSDLIPKLTEMLEEPGVDFNGTRGETRNGIQGFALNQWSKRFIKVFLARMTAYVEQTAGMNSSVAHYLAEGKGRYEVEHIWANHYRRHSDEFESAADFDAYRNRFGGLLLLPKTFNASYNDQPYAKKREHYVKENLLARSLHEKAYENNPKFVSWNRSEQLGFRAMPEFKKAELDERQALYRALADRIWDPQQLQAAANS